ncbi:hypothetical protein [Enterobacter kobei]|uniref:hypothetical protein n=1 Tax=Enterobacter kobei TaxID=208224 RepID=UPI001F493DA4|nr:hypothetical protein [Enterobacter kobei]
MLKKDFFSAIENLLKAGFQPRFYTVNSGRIGLITFTDKNGTKQVEQVYSCTSLAANTFGKRFTTWSEEIFQKHNEKKVSDSGFEVGSRVWDKLMYTVRTISEIRAGGVLVLDKEVKRFLTSKRVKARLAVSMIHEQAIAVQNTEYLNNPAYS